MKFLKTFTTTLYVFLSLFVSYAFAQTSDITPTTTNLKNDIAEVEEASVQTFNIEIEVGTQSPWNKSVPIIVKVRPNQDTTRTNVTWDTPVGIEFEDKNKQTYLAIPSGQVQVYKVRVKPIVSGTYTIASTATDWGYGANFASTSSVTITFDDNLIITPQSSEYSTAVIIRYAVILLSSIIIGFILYLLSKKGFNKLKIWLKPPEL